MSAPPEAAASCLRMVTWNVARRVSGVVEQATALAVREPDVVALQEVTRRTVSVWPRGFELMGLAHVRTSLDDADPARTPASRRSTGVMLASRTPLSDVDQALAVPWPETALGACTDTIRGPEWDSTMSSPPRSCAPSPAGITTPGATSSSATTPRSRSTWPKPDPTEAMRPLISAPTPNRAAKRMRAARTTRSKRRWLTGRWMSISTITLPGRRSVVTSPSRSGNGTRALRLGERMEVIAAEIEQDRQTLSDLMERMDISKNPVKQAAGWVAEKASRVKFSGAGSGEPDHGAFMAPESLTLGVEGKASMWKALKQVQSQYPPLASTDLDELLDRAQAQYAELERERLAAAALALAIANSE